MSKGNGLQREELFKQIVGALNEMPDLLRRTFVLRHYKGLSEKEIAVKVGVKAEEVSPLLRRADEFLYEKVAS